MIFQVIRVMAESAFMVATVTASVTDKKSINPDAAFVDLPIAFFLLRLEMINFAVSVLLRKNLEYFQPGISTRAFCLILLVFFASRKSTLFYEC